MDSKGKSVREAEGRGLLSLGLGSSTRSLSGLSSGPNRNRHLSGVALELSLYEVMRAVELVGF